MTDLSRSRLQKPQNDSVDLLIAEIGDAADFDAEYIGIEISSAVVPDRRMTAAEIEELTSEWLTAVSAISFGGAAVSRLVGRLEKAAVDTSGSIVAGII